MDNPLYGVDIGDLIRATHKPPPLSQITHIDCLTIGEASVEFVNLESQAVLVDTQSLENVFGQKILNKYLAYACDDDIGTYAGSYIRSLEKKQGFDQPVILEMCELYFNQSNKTPQEKEVEPKFKALADFLLERGVESISTLIGKESDHHG